MYKSDTVVPITLLQQLDPAFTWGYLLHDYQTDYWKEQRDIPLGVHRGFRGNKYRGQPETVNTNEKDDPIKLTQAWQLWYMRFFVRVLLGVDDFSRFPEVEQAFNSTMADNRVITNHQGWPSGHMCLGMGGNIVKILGPGRPNADFGPSYWIETLKAVEPPPDLEEVYNSSWLWSKATISRYAQEDEEFRPFDQMQSVDPFPQSDPFNAHTPLMLISMKGKANVMQKRVRIITDGMIPPTYNLPRPGIQ